MLSLHPIPASRTCRIRAGQVAWAKSSCSHLRSRRSFCPSCLLLPFQPLHSTNRRLSWPLGIVQRARQHAAPAPRTTAAAAAAKQSGEGAADNEPAGKPRAARQRQRERGVKGAPSPLPTITALRKQPKAKLVEQAQALGLPVDGVKEDLVTRLFDHYTAQAAMGPPAPIGDYVPEDSPSNLADAELAHQREGAAVEGVTVQSLLKLGKGTLKGQLDERGLATQGSKQQLAERLLHALRVAEYEALDEEEGEELRKAEMRLPAGFHREGFSSSETEALGAGDEDEQELANRQALQQARAHRDFLADRDELDIVPASYLSYDPDVTTDEEDWPPEEPDVRYGAHIPPEQQPGIIRDSEGRIVAADFGSGDQALDLLEMMSVKGADLAAEDLMREDEEFEDLLSIRDVLALDLSAEERAFLTGRIADLDADLDEPLDLEEVADELEQAFGGPYRGAEERSDQAAHAMDDSSDDLAMASAEAGAAAGEGVQEEGTGSGVEGEEGEDDDELPLMGQRWRAGDLSLADFERFLVEAEGLAEEDVGPTIEALLADAAAEQDQQGDLAEPGDADLAAADLLFAEDEVTAQETAAEDPEDRRFRRYERLPKRSYEAIAGRQDETVDEEDMEDSAANEAPVDSDLSSSRPSEEAAQSDPSATKRAQDPASSAADTGAPATPQPASERVPDPKPRRKPIIAVDKRGSSGTRVLRRAQIARFAEPSAAGAAGQDTNTAEQDRIRASDDPYPTSGSVEGPSQVPAAADVTTGGALAGEPSTSGFVSASALGAALEAPPSSDAAQSGSSAMQPGINSDTPAAASSGFADYGPSERYMDPAAANSSSSSSSPSVLSSTGPGDVLGRHPEPDSSTDTSGTETDAGGSQQEESSKDGGSELDDLPDPYTGLDIIADFGPVSGISPAAPAGPAGAAGVAGSSADDSAAALFADAELGGAVAGVGQAATAAQAAVEGAAAAMSADPDLADAVTELAEQAAAAKTALDAAATALAAAEAATESVAILDVGAAGAQDAAALDQLASVTEEAVDTSLPQSEHHEQLDPSVSPSSSTADMPANTAVEPVAAAAQDQAALDELGSVLKEGGNDSLLLPDQPKQLDPSVSPSAASADMPANTVVEPVAAAAQDQAALDELGSVLEEGGDDAPLLPDLPEQLDPSVAPFAAPAELPALPAVVDAAAAAAQDPASLDELEAVIEETSADLLVFAEQPAEAEQLDASMSPSAASAELPADAAVEAVAAAAQDPASLEELELVVEEPSVEPLVFTEQPAVDEQLEASVSPSAASAELPAQAVVEAVAAAAQDPASLDELESVIEEPSVDPLVFAKQPAVDEHLDASVSPSAASAEQPAEAVVDAVAAAAPDAASLDELESVIEEMPDNSLLSPRQPALPGQPPTDVSLASSTSSAAAGNGSSLGSGSSPVADASHSGAASDAPAGPGSSAGPAAGNGAGAAQKLPAPAQPPGVAGRSGAQRRAAAHELLAEVSLDLKEVVRLREQVALRRQVLQSMQKQVSRADESAAETRAQMEALRRQMAGLMTERRAWQQTKLKSLKDATAQVQQNMAAKAQLQAQLTGMEQQLSTLKAELAKRDAESAALQTALSDAARNMSSDSPSMQGSRSGQSMASTNRLKSLPTAASGQVRAGAAAAHAVDVKVEAGSTPAGASYEPGHQGTAFHAEQRAEAGAEAQAEATGQASSQADPPAVEAQAADLVQPGVVVAAGMLTAAEIGKEAFGLVGRWVGRLMRSREDGADT